MKTIYGIVIALVVLFGLAWHSNNQKEVDTLRQQIATMQAQQDQCSKTKEQNADVLRAALDAADTGVDAQVAFNRQWKANSTKEGTGRTGDRRLWDTFNAEQRRANEDCQRSYENAVQRAKIEEGQ